jgi:hypothetical protein
MMENKSIYLYPYVFWRNVYEDLWYAIPREHYSEFWNGNKDVAMKARYMEDLVKQLTYDEDDEEN